MARRHQQPGAVQAADARRGQGIPTLTTNEVGTAEGRLELTDVYFGRALEIGVVRESPIFTAFRRLGGRIVFDARGCLGLVQR